LAGSRTEEENTLLIDGIHIPLTTPFQHDGSLYLRKLEYNVGRYSLTPAAGLVALTGEGVALGDEETRDMLRVIGETAAPEKVLIAAVSKGSVRSALAVAEKAAEAGFDAILLRAPSDWRSLTSSELLLFFRAVADASPLSVLLHSDEQDVLPVSTIAALAEHPNILGVFDAQLTPDRYREIALATESVKRDVTVTTVFAPVTGRMLKSSGRDSFVSAAALAGGIATAVHPANAGLKTRSKTIGFQMMAAGSARGLIDVLEAGVAGAMPQLAASAPQGCYEIYAAFKDGDPALAAEKQDRLIEADSLLRELGIAGIKYGCDLNGYFGGSVRLPRLPLDGAQRAAVEQVLSSLRN
jgi:4-hydroxy-2-oxoglutarate aldolase